MKLNKKIIILIIAIIVSLSALTLFAIATTGSNTIGATTEYNLGIMLKQDKANEKLVHVLLGMTDEDSVASLQLGLYLDVPEDVNAKFEYNTSLPPQDEDIQPRLSESSNSEGKKVKRLNIYYTGTKELNPEESNEIEIGTITFEGADKPDTTIHIEPVENFSTVASLSHKDTPIAVDTLSTIVNKQEENPGGGSSTEKPETGDNDEDKPGDNTGNETENNTGNNTQNNTGNTSGDNTTGNNTNNNTSSGSENTSSGENSGSNTGSQSQNNNSNSNNNNGNGSSGNNSQNKDNGGSIIDKFVNSFKTGANKSITWVLIAIIILTIIAIIIVKIKKKQKDNK